MSLSRLSFSIIARNNYLIWTVTFLWARSSQPYIELSSIVLIWLDASGNGDLITVRFKEKEEAAVCLIIELSHCGLIPRLINQIIFNYTYEFPSHITFLIKVPGDLKIKRSLRRVKITFPAWSHKLRNLYNRIRFSRGHFGLRSWIPRRKPCNPVDIPYDIVTTLLQPVYLAVNISKGLDWRKQYCQSEKHYLFNISRAKI